MAQARVENEGKILPRYNIQSSHSPVYPSTRLFICIYFHRKWRWRSLNTISTKIFKKYQTQILNLIKIEDPTHKIIVISGITGNLANKLNGLYDLFKGGRYNAYMKQDADNTWLYIARDNKWWLGGINDKNRKRAFGWAHSITERANPWEVNNWKLFANGGWHDSDMQVNLVNKDDQSQKKIDVLESKIQDHLSISKLLFNNLSVKEKREFIKKKEFKKIFKEDTLCSHCFSSGTIVKCIQLDCSGICEKCKNESSDLCVGCGQKQIVQCPICLDEYSKEFLKILKCNHYVCWKCTAHAFEANKPLKKCPMCRINL